MLSTYDIILPYHDTISQYHNSTLQYHNIIMSLYNIIISYYNIIISYYNIIISYYNIKIELFNFVPNCTLCVIVTVRSVVKIFGGKGLRVLKCTNVWWGYDWEIFWSMRLRVFECTRVWIGKKRKLRKFPSQNLEFCENFWRHGIERSQVHKCLVRILLRV